MSADNWAECPKCAAKHITEYAELQHGIIDEYGKITPGDYLELVEKSKQPLIIPKEMREDYELGTDEDGTFSLDYRCSCRVCGFSRKVTASVYFNLGKLKDEIRLNI